MMILLNYLIFSQLFNRIMRSPTAVVMDTPTPIPTFTATLTPVPIPTRTFTPSPTLIPTATSTPVIMTEEQRDAMRATQTAEVIRLTEEARPTPTPGGDPTDTPSPEDNRPLVTANSGAVNLRSGPGTNYDRVGTLTGGSSAEIVGRTADSSWWQISTTGGLAWIAASVTTSSNTSNSIPIVDAPPPPATATPRPPTNTPQPAATDTPVPPSHQYSLANMFGQVNEGITQVRGDIRDAAGNPVNGARVRVRSGSFCTVSYMSGPQGGYQPGGYDILLDRFAKDGSWLVAVVDGPAEPNDTKCNDGLNALSEEVTAPTNTLEGVVYVEWRKNY